MKKGVPVVEHPLIAVVFAFGFGSIASISSSSFWWVHPDSNRGLTGYEPVALDR